MSFFRRELSPVERFENALREKQTARLKLAAKSRAADAVVADRRKTAEKLAVAGAADAKLARAESELRIAGQIQETFLPGPLDPAECGGRVQLQAVQVHLALVGAGLALVVAGVALAWYLTR